MKKWSLLAAVLVIGTLAAMPAMAGGNGKGGATLTLVRFADAARSADGGSTDPTFGETVGFSASQIGWIQNRCWQGDKLVYEEWEANFSSYRGDGVFTLGPTSYWQGGDATCTARLTDGTGKRTYASTSYDAVDLTA